MDNDIFPGEILAILLVTFGSSSTSPSMTGLLFITAQCDYRVANRVLLELRDIEYESGDLLHLITSRTATDIDQNGSQGELPVTPAGSLTKQNFDYINEWTRASVPEIEQFALSEAQKNEYDQPSLFIILDDQGIAEGTIIVAGRNKDWLTHSEDKEEHDSEFPKHDFNKARFPLDEAYLAWCNLEIANMSFVELCAEEQGPDEDGWWTVLAKEVSGMPARSEEEEIVRKTRMDEFAADGKV